MGKKIECLVDLTFNHFKKSKVQLKDVFLTHRCPCEAFFVLLFHGKLFPDGAFCQPTSHHPSQNKHKKPCNIPGSVPAMVVYFERIRSYGRGSTAVHLRDMI